MYSVKINGHLFLYRILEIEEKAKKPSKNLGQLGIN